MTRSDRAYDRYGPVSTEALLAIRKTDRKARDVRSLGIGY